jgi:very-short-patch-repair endonuclease
MEAADGVCAQCIESEGEYDWSEDTPETAGPNSTNGDAAEVAKLLDGTDTTEEGDDASVDESSAGLSQHTLEPMWNDDYDFSEFEAAKEDAKTTSSTASDSGDPLDKKIDNWKEQLLDLTRRSNLVDFSATKTKSLPFHRADPLGVAETVFDQETLYIRRSEHEDDGGDPADPASLSSDEVSSIRAAGATENSLANIRRNAKRFQRERGVDSLFITFGTLRWFDVDHSDSELRTPLFLVRVSLTQETNRNSERHNYEITSEDAELQINPALRKLLSAERGLQLPPDEAFSLDELEVAFAYVDDLISGFSRWRIVPEVILGIFDFSKFSLYADLEENREAIKEDPFVKAINGDPSALPDPGPTPSADQLDEQVSPRDTYQVLDADSSQQEAIEAAKRGVSFVLQGPPGTGKSQTISNIIAEKMAAGETVLFVSEKQAALDVVKNRLDDYDLGRFCLEAHGEKASKKQILEDLGKELDSDPLEHPRERDQVVDTLEETRRELNQYKEKLFYQPPNQEITPYEAFGIVSKYDDCGRIDASFGDPTGYHGDEIQAIETELETLASYEAEFNADGGHPWQHATIDNWRFDTAETVARTLTTAQDSVGELQDVEESIKTAFGTSVGSVQQLRSAATLLEQIVAAPVESIVESHFEPDFYQNQTRLEELAELSQEIHEKRSEILANYDESIFDADVAEMYEELDGYGITRYTSPSYRRLKSRILSYASDDYEPGLGTLQQDLQYVLDVKTLVEDRSEYSDLISHLGYLYEGPDSDWSDILDLQEVIATVADSELFDVDDVARVVLSPGTQDVQQLYDQLTDVLETWDEATTELGEILELSAVRVEGSQIDVAELDAVDGWLAHRKDAIGRLQSWIQYQNKRDDILTGPAGEFVEAYLDAGHPADELLPTFKRNFYTEWLNEVYSEAGLDQFSATEYNELLENFRELDQQQREYAKAEIQHRVTNRRPQSELHHAESSAQVTLRREVQKSKRHMPLRKLFDETSELVTTLKPCFMMSPLSVAQYLKRGSIEFDTVIFDEASQVMPQDAISSIIRGEQIIIAGDSKQLPPTTFFQADIESAEGVRRDLESILDEAATVLSEKRLLWHYRSRTNELIEFSNAKYYNGALRTFPDNNAAEDMGVDFVYVDDGLYDRGGSSTNEPEARRVLELVRKHIETKPNKSLGVVAFSSSQAEAIRETIEEARQNDPELDAFVAEDDALEGFFIKALENVQGDERDSLIFSVGYGPDESGKISMNFGPLNQSGGSRRLNVAVTRAKEHVQVVTSLQPGDIDLGRTGAGGVEDFKHYLEYAKHGKDALKRSDSESQFLQFDSEFEEAVYTALEQHGFDVSTQVQSSGYSIDLAITHPEKPGKYVLGIECDGAAYHSSKTARDRDRTRQAVLEDLGWTIHRIWSPDWASNKQQEIKTIEQKVDRLVNGRPTADGGVSVYEPEPVEVDVIPGHRRGGIKQYTTDWVEPTVPSSRDRSLDDVPKRRIQKELIRAVDEYGPEKRDRIYRTVISQWHLSRLGKKIKRILNGNLGALAQQGHLISHNGFLCPGEKPESIAVRTNSSTANRSVEDIPLEELARAGYLVLEAGMHMTKEDLILEIARLYNYERTGSKIKNRISDAVDVLVETGCARVDPSSQRLEYVEADVDERLLNRIYE